LVDADATELLFENSLDSPRLELSLCRKMPTMTGRIRYFLPQNDTQDKSCPMELSGGIIADTVQFFTNVVAHPAKAGLETQEHQVPKLFARLRFRLRGAFSLWAV
jgi:hypothetical protein